MTLPTKSIKPRTELQTITTRHNWRRLLLKGAIGNIKKLLIDVVKDGAEVKFDPSPKLVVVNMIVSSMIESAYIKQKELYPPLHKPRIRKPTIKPI